MVLMFQLIEGIDKNIRMLGCRCDVDLVGLSAKKETFVTFGRFPYELKVQSILIIAQYIFNGGNLISVTVLDLQKTSSHTYIKIHSIQETGQVGKIGNIVAMMERCFQGLVFIGNLASHQDAMKLVRSFLPIHQK